jgi:endonuclease YncB( thermonuclease family)
VLLSLLLGAAARPPEAPVASFSGRVVGVKDGDTLEVLREGKAVDVRLWGIDSPERGQAYGDAAKKFASEKCFGRTVKVGERGKDRYGRVLGDVFLPDGASLNREMVRSGLAWWFVRYAPDDLELQALEVEARCARRGLWQERNPLPPWRHREAEREKEDGGRR